MALPSRLPPSLRAPAALQTLRFVTDPLALLDDCHRRFGDVFTLRLVGSGNWVLFSPVTGTVRERSASRSWRKRACVDATDASRRASSFDNRSVALQIFATDDYAARHLMRAQLVVGYSLALAVGLSGMAIAKPLEPEPTKSADPDPQTFLADPSQVLLAPEEVVSAMEIYEDHPNDTVTANALVDAYVQSLAPSQRDIYTAYFADQSAQGLQLAYEQYLAQSATDPYAALQTYQQAITDAGGYDGTTPYGVPQLDPYSPAPLPGAPIPLVEPQKQLQELVSMMCPQEATSGNSDYIDPSCGGSPPPPPPPPPPTQTCFSYTDRFGVLHTRCNSSTIAYVYIHGAGAHTSSWASSNGYWGSAAPSGTSANHYFVAWNSTQSVQSQASTVRTALDALCAPQRPCVVITHSAGDMMMGLLLSQGNPWGILRVHAVASAAGGSQVANLTLLSPILWIVNSLGLLESIGGYPIYSLSLPVPIARTMYDHDATSGVPFMTYAADYRQSYRSCRWYQLGCHLENAWRGLVNGTLDSFHNGGNDRLVAYHSAIGFRFPNILRANTSCNPDSPLSPLGFGVPYTNSTNQLASYWANHTASHWQPPGQSLSCRKGVPDVPHGVAAPMMRALPLLQ